MIGSLAAAMVLIPRMDVQVLPPLKPADMVGTYTYRDWSHGESLELKASGRFVGRFSTDVVNRGKGPSNRRSGRWQFRQDVLYIHSDSGRYWLTSGRFIPVRWGTGFLLVDAESKQAFVGAVQDARKNGRITGRKYSSVSYHLTRSEPNSVFDPISVPKRFVKDFAAIL